MYPCASENVEECYTFIVIVCMGLQVVLVAIHS